ncbi:pheST operon leader peptide PheM [Yersinia enterocolitica]|uniref:pheST attenuator peptide n=1 Tax=Yersinia enterocolitica TaxID=630 RepID=A0A7U0AWI1_YEREN|nr:pheST operon leader peptide PheM [Yersinia enterocolitica]MBO0363376.1 pheST operon leader peptide PheM [Yersinia enterocolitica subsp. palearctica]EKN3317395.1 pheST operon leader peptide PheM [Yersinia enterocolitica]EKN3321167.1 pheST operon leader peptide PheM [Yersinia enterocolitica]EKN3326584.1 pheST operon leader peptide PheM [Yersinia enterocolitica]
MMHAVTFRFFFYFSA